MLAKEGYRVRILEKTEMAGGRARMFRKEGFTFDMGPSWYWMPDVFDKFFALFGKRTEDYYQLKRLDPSYKFYFGKKDAVEIPASIEQIGDIFEKTEKGSHAKLVQFLKEAGYKYRVSMDEFVYKPGLSALEFFHPKLLLSALKLTLFRSFDAHLKSYFRSARLRQMLEFPILFLGGTAKNTPALYSLMNYGDMVLGTWYPMGGMYKVVEGMVSLCESLGVEIIYNSPVESVVVKEGKVTGVVVDGAFSGTDILLATADYHHVEQQLLPGASRQYADDYWNSRVLSPSSLIFYLGIDKKLEGLEHHTLFFDEDLNAHSADKNLFLQNAELESRQKLWRWLILVTLGVLLLETWLAGRAARRAVA